MVKKVLVVEDEKPLAKALGLKLTRAGMAPTFAPDGQAALELFKSAAFDIVLLDLVLPKVDGFAVLQSLRAVNTTVPIIVLSNLGQTEDVARARELGATDYLVKADVSLAELVSKINTILSQP